MTTNKFFAVVICFVSACSHAQFYDAGMWLSAGVAIKTQKNLELSLSPEVRLNENCTRLSSAFTDLGAQYKFSKRFFITAVYRTGARNSGDMFDLRQRVQMGVLFKNEWKDFTLSYQPRWQVSLANTMSENDADFVTILRNKIKLQYGGFKKTDISGSFELFNSTSQYSPMVYRGWRASAEAERELNKRNSISVGYLIQKNVLSSPQEMDFVVLVSYQMKLNRSKKKQQEETPNQ